MKRFIVSIYKISGNKRTHMENTLVIPAAVIGVAVIVFSAAIGVGYLSGSPALPAQPPTNMAPLETLAPHAIGDLFRSEDASQVVIVTGYDAYQELCSYQQVVVNYSTGDVHILEGTGTMSCGEFGVRYPYRFFLDT
jgi:hypothetical protein